MSDMNPYKTPELVDTNKPPQIAPPEFLPRDKLACVAKYETPTQAHLLRIELEAQGIAASVHNEQSSVTVAGSLFGRTTAVSVEVFVMERNFEKAMKIKNELTSQATTGEIPEWICGCGETVDAGFEICWSCQEPYEGNQN